MADTFVGVLPTAGYWMETSKEPFDVYLCGPTDNRKLPGEIQNCPRWYFVRKLALENLQNCGHRLWPIYA